ncbi:cytochrome C oxidase subunit IV family protein [Pseudomonas fluorescens]|nr:cytochrome C oxidase subunit IV family protein [Pseudomonas fluorescens]
MTTFIQNRLTLVWLVLVVATVAGCLTRQEYLQSQWVMAVVLSITMIKARLVIMEFMELRLASWPYRLVTDAWLIIVWSLLVAMPFVTAH